MVDFSLKKLGGRKPKSPEFRFHASYLPEPNSGCWLWLGRKRGSNDYGSISVNKKIWVAHRYSWFLHNGEIPEGMLVCHTCDNPACVNPEHLWLGTHQDNADDKVRKGRQAKGDSFTHQRARGTQNGLNKLSEEDVMEIYNSKLSQRKIAKIYGVSQASINSIKKGRSWSWLTKGDD